MINFSLIPIIRIIWIICKKARRRCNFHLEKITIELYAEFGKFIHYGIKSTALLKSVAKTEVVYRGPQPEWGFIRKIYIILSHISRIFKTDPQTTKILFRLWGRYQDKCSDITHLRTCINTT